MIQHFTARHFTRLIAVGVFSYLLTRYMPEVVEKPETNLSSPMFTVILFVFLAGFLILQSIQRKQNLKLSVSIELSRLRRLVHLTEHMDATDKWKKDIRSMISGYMESVSQTDLKQYSVLQSEFRKFTHLIYEYKPNSSRDKIVYAELLEVARDAAFSRQQVDDYLQTDLSAYTRLVVVFLLIINILLLLAAREPDITSIFFITGGMMGLILVLDVLFEIDGITPADQKYYRGLYEMNSWDIEKS